MLELDQMDRFVSPVNPAIYPPLTALLLGVGLFITAWFLVYEVTSTKLSRNLMKELALAVIAAVFMGVGVMFLALTVGIYI